MFGTVFLKQLQFLNFLSTDKESEINNSNFSFNNCNKEAVIQKNHQTIFN